MHPNTVVLKYNSITLPGEAVLEKYKHHNPDIIRTTSRQCLDYTVDYTLHVNGVATIQIIHVK